MIYCKHGKVCYFRNNPRRVQDCFHQGQILFLGGNNYFHQGQKIVCPHPQKKNATRGGRISYYSQRESSFSVCLLCNMHLPLEIFHQGQTHTIFNFINGVFRGGICRPPDLICPTARHSSGYNIHTYIDYNRHLSITLTYLYAQMMRFY